jgi:hypothetical protein
VDHPVTSYTDEDRGQPFQNEYPGPSGFTADAACKDMSVRLSHKERQGIIPIRAIPAASRPPNEPASAAAEKKMAARMPNSERLYPKNVCTKSVFVSHTVRTQTLRTAR